MKNKKLIFTIFLVIIVIIVGLLVYNLWYKKTTDDKENVSISSNGDKVIEEKNEEEILESAYMQVKNKNLYEFKNDSAKFMNEMIIDNKEIEDGYEIYVKPIFIKDVTLENDNFYELYSDYNKETDELENKLIDVDKQDYIYAIKDSTLDEVNNNNLFSLINQDDLKTYKYIFKYDENKKEYIFTDFIEMK